MVHAWCLHGTCVVFAWYMRGAYVVHAWCLRGTCVVFAWYMHGVCMVHASWLHDTCMVHKMCLKQVHACPLSAFETKHVCSIHEKRPKSMHVT